MRKSPFTLVELLVSIATISILMSVLLPGLAKAKERARGIACANNPKTLGMAMAMYSSDFQEYATPPSQDMKPYDRILVDNDYLPAVPYEWVGAAIHYGTRHVLACPGDEELKSNSNWYPWEPSYGVTLASVQGGQYSWSPPLKITRIKSPSQTTRLVETRNSPLGGGSKYWLNLTSYQMATRHDLLPNALFFDGHVTSLSEKAYSYMSMTEANSSYPWCFRAETYP